MKSIIMALALVSSVSAFAGVNCANVVGKYSCDYQGAKYELKLTNLADNKIKLEMAGDSQTFTVDGLSHKDEKSDDFHTATCTAEELRVDNEFRSGLHSILAVTSSKAGVTYSVLSVDGDLAIGCTKVK